MLITVYLTLSILLFIVSYSLSDIYTGLGSVVIWILFTIRSLIDELKNKSRIKKGD